MHQGNAQATDQKPASLIDLLHFVLLDQRRTQRALLLMSATGLLGALGLVFVVILANQVPNGGIWLGLSIATGIAYVICRRLLLHLRRSGQRRSRRQPTDAVAVPSRRAHQHQGSNGADVQKVRDQL